jgi:hypothetical protein
VTAGETGVQGVDSPADDEVEASPRTQTRRPAARLGVLATWAFGVYVALALPLLLFKIGDDRWFFRDDWFFIAGHGDRAPNDLFRPAGFNSHWSTIPVVVFRVLWREVGLRSYVPYQAVVVVLHLTAAVLLWVIMRRAGVRPWLATAAAAVFVLFGPGETNILWAFQVGLVGSLAFGLTHLILADHDGPFDRRDWLGLLAGLLALMCSGVGTTMVFVVGVATLLRRGWRVAALHTAPLAAVYGVYVAVEHPDLSPFGRPSATAVWRWVRSAETGTFHAVGHFPVLAAALAVLLVTGFVVAARSDPHALRRRAALPGALLVGGLAFAVSAAFGRWVFGAEFARSSRYLHLGAAFTLPALAFAAEAVARRWRATVPLLVVLFVAPIPWNIAAFGSAFFFSQKAILTDAVRVPFATQVPRSSHPVNDPFLTSVTMGFLLDAQRAGRMPDRQTPVPAFRVNELKVRLGVHQTRTPNEASACRSTSGPLDIMPAKGTVYRITTAVKIATWDGLRRTSPEVLFEPANGRTLTIELDDLSLRLEPRDGLDEFTLCS